MYAELSQTQDIAERLFNAKKNNITHTTTRPLWNHFIRDYNKIVLSESNLLVHKRMPAKNPQRRVVLTTETSGPAILNSIIMRYAQMSQIEDAVDMSGKNPLVFKLNKMPEDSDNDSIYSDNNSIHSDSDSSDPTQSILLGNLSIILKCDNTWVPNPRTRSFTI